MIAILVILLLLLVIAVVFLVLPISIQLDSTRDYAGISWWRLLKGSVRYTDGDVILSGHLFGFRWRKSLLRMLVFHDDKATSEASAVTDKSGSSEKKGSRPRMTWRRFRRLLSSIRVREFVLRVDTDDYVTNAYMFPFAELLRSRGADVRINFSGDNVLIMSAFVRPLNVLLALIRK